MIKYVPNNVKRSHCSLKIKESSHMEMYYSKLYRPRPVLVMVRASAMCVQMYRRVYKRT